jgi:hypothetical protein
MNASLIALAEVEEWRKAKKARNELQPANFGGQVS